MEKIENIFRDLHILMGGNPLLGSVEITITLPKGGIVPIQEYLHETISANGFFTVGEAPVEKDILKDLTVQTIYGTIKFISNGN